MERVIVALLILAAVLVAAFVVYRLGARRGPATPSPGQTYTREEVSSVRAFYKPYAEFMETSPAELSVFVQVLTEETGLSRDLTEYPVDNATVQRVAKAFEVAAEKVFGFKLSGDEPDDKQLDRFANAHLIDPLIRPYFAGEQLRETMTEAEAEAYEEARDKLRVPNEPLMYYAMGAWWGEWLVRHRRCVWSLHSPLNPCQSFPDMITAGSTVCLHPFSQVTKKLTDPEGDQLAFKSQVTAFDKRALPPFPLIASLADADHAMRELLPIAAREALTAQEAGDHERAFTLFKKAIDSSADNAQLLGVAISSAWQLQRWNDAEAWMLRLLRMHPDHPMTNHNLAVLYSQDSKRLAAAVDLLERAIKADPNYARAHITLASCLWDLGRNDEARQHATWVVEHSPDLKAEAEDLLRDFEKRKAL